MIQKKSPAWIKPALDLGPILIFFAAYSFAPVDADATDDARQLSQIIFATAVFIPVILASLVASWVFLRDIPKMAIMTAVIVVVFGGLTIWLQNDTFIKMKPTVLYFCFASILGFGLMQGKSYLAYVMDAAIPMTEEGWMIFTKRFALFFVVLALANEAIWRGFDTDTWVKFKTFGLPIAMFAFIMLQVKLFEQHSIETNKEKSSKPVRRTSQPRRTILTSRAKKAGRPRRTSRPRRTIRIRNRTEALGRA